MIIEGPDGQRFEFPEGTSDETINNELTQEYATKGQKMENPSPNLYGDIAKSAGQFGRDMVESTIGLPGDINDIETSIVKWLQSQQGLAKAAGDKWAAFDQLSPLANVPFPNRSDVEWAGKQLGMPDRYTPQTPYGEATYGALTGASMAPGFMMGGRMVMPKIVQGGKKLAKWGAAGLGLAGGSGLYHWLFPREQGANQYGPANNYGPNP